MNSSEKELLQNGLRMIFPTEKNFPLDQLEAYIEELHLWNPRYGLVHAEGHELIVRHILDCCAAFPFLYPYVKTQGADIGSGAGLPGILLALFFPQMQWTLIEKSAKRVSFLENVIALLTLDNATVLPQDVGRVDAQFDLITFRAFKPLSEKGLVSLLLGLLRPLGTVALYKGRLEKIQQEILDSEIDPSAVRIKPLFVPFLEKEERHLVFFGR